MTDLRRNFTYALIVFIATAMGAPVYAGEIARANLDIVGLGLEVDRQPVTTAIDVPAYVQTIFGGKMNDEAPFVPSLSAIGELTGPGILTPITLAAVPGKKFTLPPLHEKGEYSLQNIRLVGEKGEFLQQAVPSFAIIHVEEALKTEVRARQLTPAELRERGITLDARNYDVFEYTIILGVGESRVEIPYTVVVDSRTHLVQTPGQTPKYKLPKLGTRPPPRIAPPSFGHVTFDSLPGTGAAEKESRPAAGTIPAAIILPSGFGVLHQFFAVILQVSNGASEGSNIRIDSINASISVPQQMRMAKVIPAVTLGQPVPIHTASGETFLVAGAQGQAEWTLEALKSGTHTMDVTVEAVYQKPGQADYPLRAHTSASIVVSDPRFQINFSHPDVVREGEPYTAYAFVTNLSSQAQNVVLDLTEIPECSAGGYVSNICRVEGAGVSELDIPPGEMVTVPYKLRPKITGSVFAAAGEASDGAIGVSVKLTMAVSESGIPLSAATLVMPHYARYLPSDFIAANMRLLGLGYSLATAPLNQYTAKFPRLITTDVFQRAQDITRAGQRVFITRQNPEVNDPEENRDAFMHLALDLLGNVERVDQIAIAPEMIEWDELRRMEKSGRLAAAAMARQLEIHGLHDNRKPQDFVDDFAAATSHRSPFFFAYAHGTEVAGERPYALSLLGVNTNRELDVPAEASAGWKRTLPFGELTRFDSATERGEMAILGRVSENIRVLVTPQSKSFKLHLIYPDTTDGSFLRTDIDITEATPGKPVWIDLARGWQTPVVNGAIGDATAREVPQTPLSVIAAAQDLYLNQPGHLVSILFNRPLHVADVLRLRDRLALTTSVPEADNFSSTRRNSPDPAAELQIPSAALQDDGKLIDVTFDKTLSRNASYTIAVDGLFDLMSRLEFTDTQIVPRIDNDRHAGIVTGRVLNADGSSVANALVKLTVDNQPPAGPQIDLTDSEGRFLFEFVERDIDRKITGNYQLTAVDNGRATAVDGAVRVVDGGIHKVDLVFLGRGTVRGHVRYDDGSPVSNAHVTVATALNPGYSNGDTNADGFYELTGVAVGPMTIFVTDGTFAARTAYAANVIRTAGEVVTQDLVIFKQQYRGSGTVRLTVRRADDNKTVAEARTLVQTSGYPLAEATTDQQGFVEYKDVPAGLVTFLAERFEISNASYAAIEAELKPDQILEQTIFLPVPATQSASTFVGVVKRDDPTAPSDRSKDQVVPGAILQLGPLPSVTAGADGTYVYPDIPVGVDLYNPPPTLLVFDPVTGRKGRFTIPSATSGQVLFNPTLSSTAPEGFATVRVRLTSATGVPVAGYRVFEPGFPPTLLTEKPGGVYEYAQLQVPNSLSIVAVPANPEGPYGDQMARGTVRVDFNGQIGILDLRLPGQGNIIATIKPEGSFGRVGIDYPAWDEFEQRVGVKTKVVDSSSGVNTLQQIPAKQPVTLYTVDNLAGFASAPGFVEYDGEVKEVTLELSSTGDVSGRVFAHDRHTPLAGALVKLENGSFVYGSQLTKPDGSFRFPAVSANLSFRVVAESSRDGVYRTGMVDGATPLNGGPVSNLVVVMREQSAIEGKVVDGNGQPVSLAYFWVRELRWPNRSFGTAAEPLQTDISGRFILQNIFAGPFRITARSPVIQEIRGDYQGTIGFEGDTSQNNVQVPIGGVGTGSLSISVVDSLQAFKPVPNAEVTIYRGKDPFDLGSTDDRGIVEFHDVVAGTYSVGAYSKTVGRAGRIDSVDVLDGETTTRQVALEFLGKVSGDVTDPEMVPLPNGPAKGVAVQVNSRIDLRDTTDAEGKFSLLGVPEGPFEVFAYDFETGRMAFGPSGLFISKVVQEQNDIHLELEKMATLRVKAYLPNDAGGAGELAPLVAVSVSATDYLREQQGNELAFPQMIPRYPYRIEVRELGGEGRTAVKTGEFPAGILDHTESVIFAPSGTVRVKVLDGSGNPMRDVEVSIPNRRMFTGNDGIAVFTGVPFGDVWVQASKDGAGASASEKLQSRSVPLEFVLNLGLSASIAGFVEAEEGIGLPSVGTRVVVNVTSSLGLPTRLEALTGADGKFLFSAVPIGSTRLSLIYYGPDDTTVGALRPDVLVPDGTTGTFIVDPVKIYATPLRLLSIDPPANANNVSPTSNVVITFNRELAADSLNVTKFKLIDTSDNTSMPITLQPSLRPDKTFQVTLIPPDPPAGQRFRLKSNVLYRLVVEAGIKDTLDHAINTSIGSSFTTVNYSEPSVVRIDPSPEQPLPANATLRIKFNKAVDIESFTPGNGGVLTLEKLTTRDGIPVRAISLSRFLDPTDPTVIVAGVTGELIEEASFYRLTISGIRDTQTPQNVQATLKVVDLFSFDNTKPIATIVSPVAAGEKLISDVAYTAQVRVVDDGTGKESTDVDSVDWFDADGTFLRRVLTPPYSYSFVAPATGTTYTLKVSANDLSGNSSPTREAFIWDVAPNAPPANVTVTNTPTEVYPTQAGSSKVTFTDEGVRVTVVLELRGKKLDSADLVHSLGSKVVTRESTTVSWPEASFDYTLPLDLLPGTAQVVAKVTDLSTTGTGQATLQILDDEIPPEVISFLPAAETRYPFEATYTIELKVRDAQTGVKDATLSVAGVDVPAAQIEHTVANEVHTYRTSVKVPAKNADTRVTIVGRAYDNKGRVSTSTAEVIYERLDDDSTPEAAWVTPLDQAAMPFGISGWQATLRVRASGPITSVEFKSDAFASPIAALTSPITGTDLYESKAAFTLPADGAPFTVTAVVHAVEETHTVELPITLRPVVVDPTVPAINTSTSISSITAPQYENKPLVVRGSGVRLTITVPLSVKDLLVLDGASVSTFEETELRLTVVENLFVDADSSIDVSDKGYLGAHRAREGNSLRNDTNDGRTVSGRTGATNDAAGSHAGIGGEAAASLTNVTYGSITAPGDFGSGGAGSTAAGNGGGLVLLDGPTARFVVAGVITADGGNGLGRSAAGSGGSVAIDARMLITGPLTRISANGGDDDATSAGSSGGGGGRLAIRVTHRFDATELESRFRAHGGLNGSTDGTQFIDGGAGTIFLSRPAAALGELIVSSFDARPASSSHRTRGTVLAGAMAFDTITVGPRALARFDNEPSSPITVDATASVVGSADLPQVAIVSTNPPANAQVAQSTDITPTFNAQSLAGITRARVVLTAQPADTLVNFPLAPVTVADTQATISIPASAATGSTSLKLIVTDRAGRVVESAPVAFSIVSNASPVIDALTVTHAGSKIYAGGTLTVTGLAHDDVEVKSLTLTSSAGVVTSQAATKPAPESMERQFTVALPKTLANGSEVTLTLSASDDFPNRVPATAERKITIDSDETAPSVTITRPAADQQFDETSTGTFTIEVSAIDAEVGVDTVTATFEGTAYTLLPVAGQPGLYAIANVPIPPVDGTEPAAKTITVSVTDYKPNIASKSVTIYVKPLIDPNAPKLSWVCTSPNALYPAGYTVPLRVFAEGTSSQNGVQRVEFSIDGGAPIAAPETSAGSKVYQASFPIPAATAAGTIYNVRAAAISTSSNEASLLGTFTVIAGFEINTASEITATDLAFENLTLIVRSGGVLTVTGPHTFASLIILDGGKVVQKHRDVSSADALNVGRLYVACNATIDVNGLGFARNTTYAGAGMPADSSGASHIGRGGLWSRQSGGTFGNVLRPVEGGGGGQANAGGGSVRIHASSSVTIDGSITSRVADAASAGNAAGGSVWITTPAALGGAGAIDVAGGHVTSGNGGAGAGGSIALEYNSASGALLTRLTARGGTGSSAHHGGAGTINLKSALAPSGHLVVDNGDASPAYAVTELPSLGRVPAASVNAGTIELDSVRWLSAAIVGHAVRVSAPNGSVRGTWRIASVANDSSAKPIQGSVDVRTQDAIAYDGYLYYSAAGLNGRTFVAARYATDRWEYDDDATFTTFTPQAGDGVIASFRKDATSITELVPYRCTATCGSVNGVMMLELSAGEIVPNGLGGSALRDDAELVLRPDGSGQGLIVSRGINTTIALEPGAVVQSGDTLRGVYRFDSITLTNARVTSEDLVESATAAVIDATSSLVTGNDDVPAIDSAKISIARGFYGPMVVGAAGAVTDSHAPLHVVARDLASIDADRPVWNATPTPNMITGTRGGMSVMRVANGQAQASGLSTLNAITGSGFTSFSAAQTNQTIVCGLAPADTTASTNEPGTNAFELHANGTYEVVANGTSVNESGAYTLSTVFRVEKTPASLRWLVDDVLIYELTSAIPPRLILDLSFDSGASGEIHSIDYDTTSATERYRAAVAADGSFKVPVLALAGATIALFARDGHVFPLASEEVQVGTISNDIGVQTLTFAPAEVTGGRTAIATVTLKAPAGSEGALVVLSSSNVLAAVPSSITVAAGQTTGTFNATTQPVATPVDLTISASYGGIGTTATLRVVKDNVAPAVTITAPAANTQYTEGAPAGIAVEATIVEDESGIAQATASIDGVSKPMTKDLSKGPNVYTATLSTPFIEGSSSVSKTITVSATDNNANTGSVNVTVTINPVTDTNSPTLTWSCFSSGGMYPVGDVVTLRVTAEAPNAANVLEKVEFLITDPNGEIETVPAIALGNNEYQVLYTVPAVADGGSFSVRARVVTASGTSAEITRTFIAVTDAVKISTTTTIAANDTTYDGKSVVITTGTTTITGTHAFKRLIVNSGASVTHDAAGKLDVKGDVFVACGGMIDANGKGYGVDGTYAGATAAQLGNGGSHLGYGGLLNPGAASTFGSVVHPAEAGGGGSSYAGGEGTGGGIIRIEADTLTNDGLISANGPRLNNSGAGGSVWITTKILAGTGAIEANGGDLNRGGGGGAIAVEYTSAAETALANIRAVGGVTSATGGAGTVFRKAASQTYGSLTIDNGFNVGQGTELPSFGSGLALNQTPGAILVTDRATDVPAYFEGHWVRISSSSGEVKGTWRIRSITGKSVELTPNGSEAISVQSGDRWQGLYRFDSVTLRNTTLVSNDPIETRDETVDRTVTTSGIYTTNLTIQSTGVLSHPAGGALDIAASGTVEIEAGGFIDANGKGYGVNDTYPGAVLAGDATAGSHLGYGGLSSLPLASTFGSVARPAEAGGGGHYGSGGSGIGGGVVRIVADTVTNHGTIRANGPDLQISGAGGSIWITATSITGTGAIEAKGGFVTRGGGGGAIALEYVTASDTVLNNIKASGGGTTGAVGGAGTVFLKPSTSVYGNLTIDNGTAVGQGTALPGLGSGFAQNGTSTPKLVVTSVPPPYFVGHWVEISSPSGTVKGMWRIGAINGTELTLLPNALAPDVVTGDFWRGVYVFDNLKLRVASLACGDPIILTNPIDKDASSQINESAPQFPLAKRAQIVVESAVSGDSVVGPIGAVLDANAPILLTATNKRTSGTSTANANSDGSFRIPVLGAPGDTFTIKATDSFTLPLTSGSIDVNGAISESNGVSSLTVQPATVAGGVTAYGSLRLAGPARSDGVTVSLETTSTTASVPATVFIASGHSTTQFPITTSSTASHVDVQITATFGITSKTASLAITPASATLADVVLSSSTIEGGSSLNGTVVLGAAAPPLGAMVMLTSSSPYVTVPATVVVTQGNTEASFAVSTSKVGAPSSAIITATWGASDSATLTLSVCSAMVTAAPPPSTAVSTVWIDDAPPAGPEPTGDATFDTTQSASGTKSIHFAPPTTSQQRRFSIAGVAPLAVTTTSELVLYVLVNPCKPPRQVLVTWSDGSASWRASLGESRISYELPQTPAGSLPGSGEWTRLAVNAKALGITSNKNITSLTIEVDGGEVWFDLIGATTCALSLAPRPDYLPNETVWFDDEIPAGALPETSYSWDTTQAASGSSADLVGSVTGTTMVQHYFTGATSGLALNIDDVLLTYVLIDPCNPPRELMLQWDDGSGFKRRAYWGENLINAGSQRSVERRRMGGLPDAGKWVRLEIPVASMMMSGMTVRGMAFTLYGGRAWFDRVAKVSRVNLALGKAASHSSSYQNDSTYGSSNVNDGNTTNYNHTNNDVQSWWEVDLGAVQPIDAVDVWNSQFSSERLQNFWVLVSDQEFTSENLNATLSQTGVTAYYYLRQAGRPTSFEINRTGRYVRVQLAGQNYLHLSEVHVWAPVSQTTVNLAAGRAATQSSTHQDAYIAALSVNGNAIGESGSHTRFDTEAWWQVDLGSVQPIGTIDIDNTPAYDWMANFYVFVSDDPFPSTLKVADARNLPNVSVFYRTSPISSYKFDINRPGRFVRIQLTGTNYLHPMEVRIRSASRTIGALSKSPETR